MNMIEKWQDKSLKCYFCGETKSVKYKVKTLVNKEVQTVCVCNKCILINRRKVF